MTPDVVGDPVNPFDDLDGDPVDDLACYSDDDQLACQSSRQSNPAHPSRPWRNPGQINNGNEQENKETGVIFIRREKRKHRQWRKKDEREKH